ncbi:MAG: PKD domain-containing protein [Bacteroidia bacterium]|nr:PKD domain-containing protein [Bacteroidia bacterium]
MWASGGTGEGIFTCYNFQQGQSYQICFWVRNTTTQGQQVVPNGSFTLEATTGLTQTPVNLPIQNPPTRQQIDTRQINTLGWTQITIPFTPNQNFTQLWFYPTLGAAPPQYEIQIDDVVVSRVVQQNEITISATSQNLTWCQSTTLSLTGVPPGATVTWSPAAGLNTTTGNTVIATPCVPTIYSANVVFNGTPECPVCTPYNLVYLRLIDVNPPPFTITGNPNIICGDNLSLLASPVLTCPGITYSWQGPNGFSTIGAGFSIPQAGPQNAGTYTLTVTNGCGGTVTQTVNVTYDCPCLLKPTITTSGCNPVSFAVTNSSLTNIVGWFWEFGDGNTSNLANPTHLYAQNGSYVVCVTVIGKSPRGEMCCTQVCDTIQACGCSGAAPFFSWSPRGTNGATFTNMSLATPSVCGWLWDFGDGNTSTANNPSHQYASAGTYTVCLIAYTCYPNPSTNTTDTCASRYCQTITIGSGGGKRLAETNEEQTENSDMEVKLFPNPASTELFVVLPEGITGEVRLLSADGKELMRLQNNGSNTYTANLKDIAPGMYLIEVVSNGNTTKRMTFVKE